LRGNLFCALFGLLLDDRRGQQPLFEPERDQPLVADTVHQALIPGWGHPSACFLILTTAGLKTAPVQLLLKHLEPDIPRLRNTVNLNISEPHQTFIQKIMAYGRESLKSRRSRDAADHTNGIDVRLEIRSFDE